MATLKIITREQKRQEDGKLPLYFRITNSRRSSYFSLGITVEKEEWDAQKQKVRKNHPNALRLNNYLTKWRAKAEEYMLELADKNANYHPKLITKRLKGDYRYDNLFSYMDRFLGRVKSRCSHGYYKKAKGIISKFKRFCSEGMRVQEVTLRTINKYEKHMQEELGNSKTTIRSNMKVLRKVFTEAEREKLIKPGNNPFEGYRMPSEKTERIFLDEDELKRVESVELPQNTLIDHTRNLYVFACYAGGIRVSDLLQLKWRNITETHVRFKMRKTGEVVSVKLPRKAQEILEIYKQKDQENEGLVFPFLKPEDFEDDIKLFNAISSKTALLNKYLKKLAQKADIDKPVTFHTSRHTFATRALRKGMRIEYVSKILGHSDIKTTQIYTKIINKDLDKAMEVFDH
jgi:integrase